MGRYVQHLIKDSVQDGHGGITGAPLFRYSAWCGQWANSYSDDTPYGFARNATGIVSGRFCPKCSSKFYATVIKDTGISLGEKTPSIEDDTLRGVKSAYPIKYDGDLVGYLCIDQGWGKQWYVSKLTFVVRGGVFAKAYLSVGPVKYRSENGTLWNASQFASKEEALYRALTMAQNGFLDSETVVRNKMAAAEKALQDQIKAREETLKAEEEAAREELERRHALAKEVRALIYNTTDRPSRATLKALCDLAGFKIAEDGSVTYTGEV